MAIFTFKCPCCDRCFTGLPAIMFPLPDYAHAIPERDHAARVAVDDDTCVVDSEHYFVRARLIVPIVGEEEALEFGIWGSLSAENFSRYAGSIGDPRQSRLGAMFSYVANTLPLYEESTQNLRSQLWPRDDGQRPVVELDPSQTHPLVGELRDGISRERAISFAVLVLPKH